MSRYEWERGEFSIPTAEWAGFKAKIREAMNELHVRQFEIAKKLHERLVVLAKKDKNFDVIYDGFEEIEKLRLPENQWSAKPNKNLTESDESTVVHALAEYSHKNGRYRLVRPTQKMFPKLGNNVTEFSNSCCNVVFDNNAKKVIWDVPENNHACEHARETELGKIFFKTLDEVEWTRGSGGHIWGGDEYHEDASREHDCGESSYSKGSWGPKEPARKQSSSEQRVYNIYNSVRR